MHHRLGTSRSSQLACAALCTFLMATVSTVQSQTADKTVRDPRLVLDSALNRIFEGRDGVPEGDRRSLALTAAEHAAANDAGQKFNTSALAFGYGYPDAPIYDPRFPEQAARHKAALEQLLAKFKGRDELSEQEKGEVRATIAPFVRYLEVQAQLRTGSIVIPPKTRSRFHFASYCMDSSWAGPRGGEKMQLVPVETLLPGRLAEIYRDLVRRASLGNVNHGDLQGLIWTLRQVAKDLKGEKAVTLSDRQRRLLDEASPNGYAAFEAARRPLGRSALPKELEQMVRDEVEQAVGQMEKEGGFATRSMDSDELVMAVEQQLERIRTMPVNEPIPTNNSHYTCLAPQVYARAVYGSLDVQVANDSDKPYTFDSSSLVAQSERQVQRMGMVTGRIDDGGTRDVIRKIVFPKEPEEQAPEPDSNVETLSLQIAERVADIAKRKVKSESIRLVTQLTSAIVMEMAKRIPEEFRIGFLGSVQELLMTTGDSIIESNVEHWKSPDPVAFTLSITTSILVDALRNCRSLSPMQIEASVLFVRELNVLYAALGKGHWVAAVAAQVTVTGTTFAEVIGAASTLDGISYMYWRESIMPWNAGETDKLLETARELSYYSSLRDQLIGSRDIPSLNRKRELMLKDLAEGSGAILFKQGGAFEKYTPDAIVDMAARRAMAENPALLH